MATTESVALPTRGTWPSVPGQVRAGLLPALTIGTLAILVLMALLADFVAPYSPTAIALDKRLLPPLSEGYFLGTDGLGRDILSRIIHGSRISLTVAAVSVLLGGAVGTALGVIAGYFGGGVDAFIMRVGEIALGFPLVIFAILFSTALGPSFANVVLVLALVMWARFARIARGETLQLREKDFIAAARIVDAPTLLILRKHILPHLVNSLLILASLQAAWAVIIEASLSFFGAGVPPPAPSWGGMIYENRGFVTTAWWAPFFPGCVIVALVLSLNLLGDWLRDKLDPRLQQSG